MIVTDSDRDSEPAADAGKVRRTGNGMIAAGWLLALVLLTVLFNGLLNRQQNPNSIRTLAGQDDTLVLQANRAGMYVASGYLNGLEIDYLLDTGATYVAVPLDTAQAAGLEPGPIVRLQTANGDVAGWTTIVPTMRLGPLVLKDVKAVIIKQLDGPVLLGMSALRDLRLTQSNGVLELSPDS